MLGRLLRDLRPRFAEAAQKVVDDWDEEELGGGGVCDRVAEALLGVVGEHLEGAEGCTGAPEGEDHEWIVVWDDSEAYLVDIPAGVYETGGGYSWKKRPEVEISPEDVLIERLDYDLVKELSND